MIANLQVLRALAAILVVVHHVRVFVNTIHPATFTTDVGAIGVDIFFVISGFVMVYTNRDATRTPAQFWRERAVRILPMYWLVTIALIGLYFIGFRPLGLHGWSWADVAASLLLVPNIRTDGWHEPILTPGWTLIYEAFFYLVFGLMLALRDIRTIVWSTTALFVVLVVVGLLLHPEHIVWRTYTNPLLLEFSAGCLIGLAYTQTSKVAHQSAPSMAWTMLALATVAIVVVDALARDIIYASPLARTLLIGTPSAIIVWCALSLEQAGRFARNNTVLTLGAASYSIYLVHQLVLQATWKFLAAILPQGHIAVSALMATTAVLAAIAAGLVMHRWLEQPVLAMMRRFGATARTPKAAPA